MNRLKNIFSKPLIFSILTLFVIFSYFKLYTIQVTFNNDPTVAIVKTDDIHWLDNTTRISNDILNDN